MEKTNINAQEEFLLGYEDFGEGEIYFTGILPEEIQLQMICGDKNAIIYISNPTQRVLEEVYGDKLEDALKEIEDNKKIPKKYQYLNHATEDVQLEAIKKEWYLIRYIENPSEVVQLASVDDSYVHISEIKNPAEKVQKLALIKSINALHSLRFVTPVKTFNEIMKELLSNPRVKTEYVIEFLESYFITGDQLEFINRYGSKKAKRIGMEFALSRGL